MRQHDLESKNFVMLKSLDNFPSKNGRTCAKFMTQTYFLKETEQGNQRHNNNFR